jgi:hypothetical protein
MATSESLQSTKPLTLDSALRYAVVHSWDELMPQTASGSIQIEYRNAVDGELQYLKVWKSTELGHWDLVAEFWERSLWGNAAGLRMGKDYLGAAGTVRVLEFVLEHQANFSSLAGMTGVLQIFTPTREERDEATAWMAVALAPGGVTPVTPLAA